MSAEYIGSKSLGETIPSGFVAVGAVVANLQAQLAGAIAASVHLSVTPPSLAGNLTAALALVAALEASIALALPVVDFQVAALAVLIADIQAQLALILAFSATFGAQVHMWIAAGKMGTLGGDLAAAVGSGPPSTQPTDDASAVLIAATSPASRVALSAFFGVTFR